MRTEYFQEEAIRCRQLAKQYCGRSEARFLLSAAKAFEELQTGGPAVQRRDSFQQATQRLPEVFQNEADSQERVARIIQQIQQVRKGRGSVRAP